MKMRLTFQAGGDNFKVQEYIERLYSHELNMEYDTKYPNDLFGFTQMNLSTMMKMTSM